MRTRDTLVNILLFMERSPMTGKEAFAWVETYRAVEDQIREFDFSKGPPPVDNAYVAPGCERFTS